MKRRIIALIIYLLVSLAAPAVYQGAHMVKAETIKLLLTYYHIKAIIPLIHMKHW